jgi:hypothetical protein
MNAIPYVLSSSLAIVVPIGVVIAFTLLFIPSLLVTGAKPEGVGRAITAYMLKTLGLIFVGLSAVEFTYGLIVTHLPSYPIFSVLALLFAIGVALMIHASRILQSIDSASSVVVKLIFFHSLEVLGVLTAVISALFVGVTFVMTKQLLKWELPTTLILLGVITALVSSMHLAQKNGKTSKVAKKK